MSILLIVLFLLCVGLGIWRTAVYTHCRGKEIDSWLRPANVTTTTETRR